jgi:DNA-binding transcriptional ArsR family regulator
MGSTKRQYYSENQIEISNLCKVLGHPARITMVELLITHNNLNCNDIRAFIPLAQSTVTNHLKILFENGVIGALVVDNKTYYKVNPSILNSVKNHLNLLTELSNGNRIGIDPIYFKSSALA